MEEMKEKKYIKIGKRVSVQNYWAYECGYVPEWDIVGDGFMGCVAFKDEEIFLNEPDEVCYLPEVAFVNSFEPDLPRWCVATLIPPRETSMYSHPWSWTANEFKAECKKFLEKHPKFHLDVDEFAHYFFKVTTSNVDLSNKIDPFTSDVSIYEAAKRLQEGNDELERALK